MGRNALAEGQRRGVRLEIRLRSDEAEDLAGRANELGLSVAAYVRQQLFATATASRPPQPSSKATTPVPPAKPRKEPQAPSTAKPAAPWSKHGISLQ